MKSEQESAADAELVAAINDGDSVAFEQLYARYRGWVHQLAFRFTGNHEDAQDVLQETFSYVIRKFPGFELTSSMKTFLFPVVRNLSIAHRKKSKRVLQSEELLDELESTPAQSVESAESRLDDLRSVINALPELQRNVLLMKYVDDMTTKEIADALEVAVGTVKSRLHHALKTLRNSPRAKTFFDEH